MANPDINGGDNSARVAAGELGTFLERVERLTEEKQTIADDIKAVKAEAKAKGYDRKTFDEMLKLRALDPAVLAEREALRHTYGSALGLFD